MKTKLLSLLCCLLMMSAAALCVNKSLAGFPKKAESVAVAKGDTLTVEPDGNRIIHTRLLCDTKGYAGPVPLDIKVSPEGRIVGIIPLENAETPGFFKRAEHLLDGYIGHTPEEAENMEVDVVSGATYSSQALIDNVRRGTSFYLVDTVRDNGKEMPWKMWVALAVTLCACIIPLLVKNKVYRNVQLVANIVVLGFWCGQFLDYSLMLRYLSNGISFPAGLTAVCMLVAAFIYPLFSRPQHYCNYICPLGSAQMLMAQVCGFKLRIGARTVKALDWFRRILWAVLMVLLWADVAVEWMDLELFRVFMPQSASVGIIVAAVVFIALSAVVNRPYCRFVCPTGSLFKRAENIG